VPTPLNRTFPLGLGIAALALLLSMPAGLRGADGEQTQQEASSLSDTVGDALDRLRPLIDTKDWSGGIKLIDGLLANADAESYDRCFLLETKARILTQKGDYVSAIEPLEGCLALADKHHFLTKRQEADMLYFMSQLYYQEAEGSKKQHEEQVAEYEKAIEYIQRWIKIAPKLTEEVSEYYSRLLYAKAVAKDSAHPDVELIKQARQQIEKTMLLNSHPKDSTYVFLLATLQQEQNYAKAAEIFELLLSKNPNNKTYWQDLLTLYIVQSQNTKDPAIIRKFNIRAINTLERAQALGFMETPRDNYLLFTFYYECAQYGTAANILYKGLKEGSIDSDLDKWELLANSYQQINQDFKAIEVYKEAAKRFPTQGVLDLKIGSIYSQLEDGQKAYEFFKLAMETGGLPKSQEGYLYVALAYQAYELGKYEDAKVAIDKAIAHQKGEPDHQQQVLKTAIEDAIKKGDAKKAAAAASEKL
jgi:tetratricopeptide (TPR) repeat protein